MLTNSNNSLSNLGLHVHKDQQPKTNDFTLQRLETAYIHNQCPQFFLIVNNLFHNRLIHNNTELFHTQEMYCQCHDNMLLVFFHPVTSLKNKCRYFATMKKHHGKKVKKVCGQCAHVRMHVCMCVCMRAHACVCVCVRARVHACVFACTCV